MWVPPTPPASADPRNQSHHDNSWAPAMDLSPRIAPIRQGAEQVRDLLQHESVVVAFGQRSTLCFVVAGPLGTAQVVGAFTTAAEALDCIARQRPSFLLCGDQLEAGCGIDLVCRAKGQRPELRTLLLISGRPQPARLRAAVAAGCDGLLLDSSLGLGRAATMLDTICRGGIVVDRGVVELLRQPAAAAATAAVLSPRESEVLSLLAQGQDNAEIAATLVIAMDTVKSHVKSLLLKLGARGRTHAAVLAIEQGLVEWPQSPQAR